MEQPQLVLNTDGFYFTQFLLRCVLPQHENLHIFQIYAVIFNLI
jgi:hypothetical protein